MGSRGWGGGGGGGRRGGSGGEEDVIWVLGWGGWGVMGETEALKRPDEEAKGGGNSFVKK